MLEKLFMMKKMFFKFREEKSDNKGIRKSDGRMTYQPVMNEILDIIIRWVGESQNPFDIYRDFYELNDRHNYGHEVYDETTKSVANAMLIISKK